METLIKAYGGKLSKYGIDLPVDQMLAALGGGGYGTGGQGAKQKGNGNLTAAGLASQMGGMGPVMIGGRGDKKIQNQNYELGFGELGGSTGTPWFESSRGAAERMGMDFTDFDAAGRGSGLTGKELLARYDTAPNSLQALGGLLTPKVVDLGLAAVDRGMLDKYLYGGQMIQPIKENPDAFWNKGNVIGSTMDFENVGSWAFDPNQFYGTYNAWGF